MIGLGSWGKYALISKRFLLCPVSSIIACNLELFGDTSLALLFIDFGIAINIPFLGLSGSWNVPLPETNADMFGVCILVCVTGDCVFTGLLMNPSPSAIGVFVGKSTWGIPTLLSHVPHD